MSIFSKKTNFGKFGTRKFFFGRKSAIFAE